MLEGTVESGLRELQRTREALLSLERTLVVRARLTGATWTEIGEPLGLTKQAVRRRHLASDPIFARRALRPPTIAEYHAEMFAALRARGSSTP